VKVGDLIKEIGLPEIGLVVKITLDKYAVLCPNGKIAWFSDEYVEEMCEVVE